MQEIIRMGRISHKPVALVAIFVAVALLVGFAAGFAVSTPSPVSVSPGSIKPETVSLTRPQGPTSGWVYQQDSVSKKWYGYHYESTPAGLMIGEPFELQNAPGNPDNRCGLVVEPDC